MALVCISIGSNLNNPYNQVETAIASICELPKTQLDARSQLYQTQPWGVEDQPDFINAVLGIETELDPATLLTALQQIERAQGRERTSKWGPRVIDLDIICYAQITQDEPNLTLPHPFFSQRCFVLMPLKDVYPDLVINQQSCRQWFDNYIRKHKDEPLPLLVSL